MSAKEAVIEIVQQMPDDLTFEEILYRLYVREQITEGVRQLDAGEGIPHEEAMQRLSRWLK